MQSAKGLFRNQKQFFFADYSSKPQKTGFLSLITFCGLPNTTFQWLAKVGT
jgi:hypothetical protein